MNPMKLVGESLRAASRATQFLPPQQGTERRKLVEEIRDACITSETAYKTVLERLRTLKSSSRSRESLAYELRRFSSDKATRAAFKPETLSQDVNHILHRLERDVDRLKYPIDFWRIYRLESAVASAEEYDRDLTDYYDDYARTMEALATQLQSAMPDEEPVERQAYAEHVITSFESDLEDALKDIEAAKDGMARVA